MAVDKLGAAFPPGQYPAPDEPVEELPLDIEFDGEFDKESTPGAADYAALEALIDSAVEVEHSLDWLASMS